MLSKVRDMLYHFVYTEGDAALQLGADIIRGVDNPRAQPYVSRQLKLSSATKKPLTKQEKSYLLELLARQENESVVAYWKRRKAILAYPDKRALLKQYSGLKQSQKQLTDKSVISKLTKEQKLQALEQEFAAIRQLKDKHGQQLKP